MKVVDRTYVTMLTNRELNKFHHPQQLFLHPSTLGTYQLLQTNAKNASTLAQIEIKDYYNRRHTLRFFQVKQIVNLHLHCVYTLPRITNHQTGKQFVRLLKVLKWIKRLAYKPEILVV